MDMVEWQSAQAGKPYRKPVCDGLFDRTVMLSLVTLTSQYNKVKKYRLLEREM
jgi:hypothetical protein